MFKPMYCALPFIATLVLTAGSVAAQDTPPMAVYAAASASTFEAMIDKVSQADVVFVGEEHDNGPGHEAELAILTALVGKNARTALSMEMFERDVQLVLDEYLSGAITESAFLQASRPWPNYKTDYRPMVELCREHGLPVVAANAPRRYVNIVSRKGQPALQDLPRMSRSYLTPLPYSMELPKGYDDALNAVLGEAHGGGATSTPTTSQGSAAPAMPSLDNMKQAQALWDSTMADSIVRFTRGHRGVHVMQVNGSMHSDHGFGIVDRLRHAAPRLKIAVVTIRPDAKYPNTDTSDFADLA